MTAAIRFLQLCPTDARLITHTQKTNAYSEKLDERLSGPITWYDMHVCIGVYIWNRILTSKC